MWRRVWIEKRRSDTGHTYRLRWYNEKGIQRSENVGPGRRRAEKRRSDKETELNRLKGELDKISLADFREEHLSLVEGQLASASVKDQRETLAQFCEFAGEMALDRITTRTAETFFAKRLRKVKSATANKNLRTLKSIFNQAIRRGYLDTNPFTGIKPVREPRKDLRVLTEQEITKLLNACPHDRWQTYVFLALTTGMRRGELSALEWSDLDLENGVVTVRNKKAHFTKSRKVRKLALPPAAVEMLEALRSRTFGDIVFQTSLGTPMVNHVNDQFKTIVEDAGIPHCTIHDLRRTFCSHLAMSGANQAIVQKLAGHASITTTLNHYTSIFPEALRSAQMGLHYANVSGVTPKSPQRTRPPKKGETAQVVTSTRAAS